jgi:hypothetical protein
MDSELEWILYIILFPVELELALLMVAWFAG